MARELSEADLERLNQLASMKEKGILTEEEFADQKANFLSTEGPSQLLDDWSPAAERSNRLPLILGGLLLAVLALLTLRMCSTVRTDRLSDVRATAGEASTQTTNEARPTSADAAVDQITLASAFEAAFGRPSSARVTVPPEAEDEVQQTFIYEPFALIPIDDQFALISLGQNVETSHAAAGTMAVHYIRPGRNGVSVLGAWREVIPGSTWGSPPLEVVTTRTLSSNPVIYSEAGGTWQGITCTWAQMVELHPQGPEPWPTVHIYYADDGSLEPKFPNGIEGRIGSVEKNRSFTIKYSGDLNFSEKYVRRGSTFHRTAAATKMPEC